MLSRLMHRWLRKNQVLESSKSRKRRLWLEVERLEDRNLLSPAFFVPMTPIATGLGGSDITSAVGDINGDGHLDVLSTSSQTVFENVNGITEMVPKHEVVWYENDGAAAPSFTPHTIAVANSEIPWVGLGDIDGNGTLDAVMEINGQIWSYGNNGDGTVWTPHLVPGAQGDLSVWIADVSGNGHNDLILPYGNTITWWENVKGDGTEWAPHVISDQVSIPPPAAPSGLPPPSLPRSDSGSTGDSSSSGRVVAAGQGQITSSGSYTMVGSTTAPDIFMAKNNVSIGDQLITPGVTSTVPSGLALSADVDHAMNQSGLAVSVVWGRINILSVGDINSDGNLDVISSGLGSITWWENPGSKGGGWIRHDVFQGNGYGDVRMAFAEDINSDGKLDIISSGFGNISWWENTACDGSTWVRHKITSNDAQSITVGDINGDGHPDLFSFAPMSSVATWYENDGAANPSL